MTTKVIINHTPTPPHLTMKNVLHHITTMTRYILIGTLFSLSFALFGQSQSIIQDQLKAYKTIQANSTTDISAKYAVALSKLLEAAQKAGDKAAEEEIRIELAGAGHPVKDDWIIGTWSIPSLDSPGNKRTWTFTPDGKAVMEIADLHVKVSGLYFKINQTVGYKVDVEGTPFHLSQDSVGRTEILHWANKKDYPNKSKARKGTATRVP